MSKKPHASRIDLKALCENLLADQRDFTAAVGALAKRLEKDAALRMTVARDVLKRYSERTPAAPHGRRLEGVKRRGQPLGEPTLEQKAGALQAERAYVATIFDHKMRGGDKLGDIKVSELRAIADRSLEIGTRFIWRGYDDIVEGFACVGLSKHCVASDPFAKVRDVIKPSVANEIFQEAQIAAAKAVEEGHGRLARELMAAADNKTAELEKAK